MTDVEQLQGSPPSSSKSSPQFQPLSSIPVCPDARMPSENPIDKMVLSKPGQKSDPEEKIEKDIKPFICDTNDRITYALNQAKHQKAVQTELKTLLEHERKVLVQLTERASKFSMMKEENKKKIDEWEGEHNQRMPFYMQYLNELMELPEDHCLTQEGVPTTVEQNILYKIVENTSHIANNSIVQLSMQNTLVNEVDLSLAKLRQFCAVMIKHVDNWLKLVNGQIDHQVKIIQLWENIKQKIKDLKEMKVDDGDNKSNRSAAEIQELEARVSKLENTVGIQGVDPTLSPKPTRAATGPKSTPPSVTSPVRPPECPPCPPCPPPRHEGASHPTGRDYFGDMYQTPSPPCPQQTTPAATYVDGRIQRSRTAQGQYSFDLLDTPGIGFPVPVAAMEKEGRTPGQCVPLTPTTPPPHHYKTFTPTAASSPRGPIREAYDYSRPEPPPMDQFRDPAILPKIQEDLQKLAVKNKKLEELVNNFRKMRQVLTEEMDKAVKLNQKLQRDLYYVSQEASKQP